MAQYVWLDGWMDRWVGEWLSAKFGLMIEKKIVAYKKKKKKMVLTEKRIGPHLSCDLHK